jgi:hypothetical protein
VVLTAEDIDRAAVLRGDAIACERCAPFASRGWEAFPSTVSEKSLERVGVTWDPEQPEPTVEEFHESGSSLWTAAAPIALHFHPYNRCELWQCRSCQKPYLRYTEYGGYYEEKRIRELRPELITHVRPGQVQGS